MYFTSSPISAKELKFVSLWITSLVFCAWNGWLCYFTFIITLEVIDKIRSFQNYAFCDNLDNIYYVIEILLLFW